MPASGSDEIFLLNTIGLEETRYQDRAHVLWAKEHDLWRQQQSGLRERLPRCGEWLNVGAPSNHPPCHTLI